MLICFNGHIINDRLEDAKDIQEEYCHICGGETTTFCLHCKAPIRGVHKIPGVIYTRSSIVKPESFCYHCGHPYPWHKPEKALLEMNFDTPISILHHIFIRFPSLVRQLSQRYDQRSSLEISDEHDLQDFLQVLLVVFFDQVDPIENKAMHNFGGLKSDILLEKEKIVLVCKMTNSLLKNAKLLEHLKSDIGTYTKRTDCDCQTLVYFIYDPNNFLINPANLKTELEACATDKLQVQVFISSQNLS